jgi:hypothetical protein
MHCIFEAKHAAVGKYVLGILGVLSLIWIGYVGINLTSLGTHLSPETTFGPADQSVVVVHKPLELDYQEPAFAFLYKEAFYTAILTHTERIQHFYFSASRPLVLLERSKPWSTELIDRYFASMDISTQFESAKSFKLSNGWTASYDKEFLRISQLGDVPAPAAIDWKYVDRKSSASVIRWEKGAPMIENAYRNNLTEIRYISQASAAAEVLVDDQDLFQDIIPEPFGELEFFEKNYLRSLDASASGLPFEWMSGGAMLIRFGNNTCVVTDCIPGQDPIAILGDHVDENSVSEDKNSAFVHDVPMSVQLLPAKGWYIELFNNRVFIASEKSAIDDILGAYETGHTLSQNEQLREELFLKAPKRVSYRHISAEEHRTMSLLNRSRHTVVQRFVLPEAPPQQPVNEQPGSTIRIEGGIAQIIPVQGSNFMYVLSKDNVVYGIQGDEERWKVTIPSAVIGTPALSYSENELIVTTATSIHQLTRNGNDLNGQAITLTLQPVAPAVSYSWKGATQLAVVSAQQLQILNTNGTKKTSVALSFAPRETPFVVWVNAGDLTATILGKTRGINISIDRKRKGKEFTVPETELEGVKTPNGPLFYGIQNKRLISVSYKGQLVDLNRGNVTTLLPVSQAGKESVFQVLGKKRVYTYSANGQLLGSASPTFDDIAGCSYQTTASGKSVVGILDGIANKNYIYNLNGQQLTKQSFDGTAIIVLHRLQNGKLIVISQSNNYLVRYPIE